MGALDTIRDIGGMIAGATIGKEVISLLKEKMALLADQISTLEQQKTVLSDENAGLKRQITELQGQLANLAPSNDELEDGEIKILRFLFNNDECALEYVASSVGISIGMAQYHCDRLVERLFISRGGFVGMNPWGEGEQSLGTISLRPEGRAEAVRRKLV